MIKLTRMDRNELHRLSLEISQGRAVVYTIARDEIYKVCFNNLPIILNLNTGFKDSKGKHWLCFYIYKCLDTITCDYFDSFGETLSQYVLGDFPVPVRNCNSRQLQSNVSSFCGHYCLLFSYFRLNNFPFSFSKLHDFLTNRPSENDKIVKRFYKN